MAPIWMLILAGFVAAAVYGLRSRVAGEPSVLLEARRPSRAPGRPPALHDHQDFSEETVPAVLSRPGDWDDS